LKARRIFCIPTSKPIIFTALARALGRKAIAVIIIDIAKIVVKIVTQGDMARPLDIESPKNSNPKNIRAIASPSTIRHRDLYRSSPSSV
jgi:hypothetical protein